MANNTRGRRGYMDDLFGEAFTIVLQWMGLARRALLPGLQKERYMLRRMFAFPDTYLPGGIATLWHEQHVDILSLRRQVNILIRLLGGPGRAGHIYSVAPGVGHI